MSFAAAGETSSVELEEKPKKLGFVCAIEVLRLGEMFRKRKHLTSLRMAQK